MQSGNIKKRYVIDIDGTICTNTWGEYQNAQPIFNNIIKANELYDKGYEIWYFTARGSETGMNWREITESQLASWGVRYHKLLFNKPAAYRYIDDKAIHCEEGDWEFGRYQSIDQ